MDYRLVATFAAASAFDFLLPVALAFWLRRRFHIEWRYLAYGALVFLGSQVITRIPAVLIVQSFLAPYLRDALALEILWIFVLSLSAGIFEEGGRYLGYSYLFKDGKTWRNALMYGAGHGGLEAVLLGGLAVLLSLVNYIVIFNLDPTQLPAPQAEQIQQAKELFASMPWWMPLLGAFERAGALAIQISLSVIVLQRFLRHSLLWLGAAIAYHTMVNLAAVLVARFVSPLAAEGIVALFAAISLYLVLRLRSE